MLDLCFLHGYAMPTLAILFEDHQGGRHLTTHTISVRDKDFQPGPWSQPNLELTASGLISIPPRARIPSGGCSFWESRL